MKSLIKFTYIAVLTMILLISCKNGLEANGFQDNPNATNNAPTPNILGQAELAVIFQNESDNTRIAGMFSGYIEGILNQWGTINSYSLSPGSFDSVWSLFYVDGLRAARIAKNQAIEEGNVELASTATLIEALLLTEIAANWGDIPNTEAIGSSLNPVYDSQESVLNHSIDLLNSVIADSSNGTTYLNDGIGGVQTLATLGELANSIKARTYLILKDYPNALTSSQSGISTNGDGLLSIHSDDNPNSNNVFNQFFRARPDNIAPTNSYLESLLDVSNTNAVRLLTTPGDTNRYDFYYSSNLNFNDIDGIFAVDASLPIISWYETKLIEAEAAFRTNNENVARTALNAVRSELTAEFGGDFPDSNASGNTLLLHIMEEKYVTLFPSAQTFHDLSRTNNLIGVTPNIGTELPVRYIYVQDEINGNTSTPDPVLGIFVPTPVNN